MRYFALLAVCLMGCGNMYVDCTYAMQAGGMSICFDYIPEAIPDPQQVEDVVAYTEEAAQTYYGRVGNFRQVLQDLGMFVQVTKGNLVAKCDKMAPSISACRNINGFNHRGHYIAIEAYYRDSCLMWTALSHELLHTIDMLYIDGGQENADSHDIVKQHSSWMVFDMVYAKSDTYKPIESIASDKIISAGWKYKENCYK